jgi:RimJ/RimL family protein N-acetyltransferase
MTFDAPATWRLGPLACHRVGPGDLAFRAALFRQPPMVAHRPCPVPDTMDDSAAAITGDIAHWAQHRIGRWCVMSGGQRIGFCGLTVKDEYDGLNMSVHIAPEHQGKGHATGLIGGMIELAQALRLPPARLYALVRPVNRASAQVFRKQGFACAGSRPSGGAPTGVWVLELMA